MATFRRGGRSAQNSAHCKIRTQDGGPVASGAQCVGTDVGIASLGHVQHQSGPAHLFWGNCSLGLVYLPGVYSHLVAVSIRKHAMIAMNKTSEPIDVSVVMVYT